MKRIYAIRDNVAESLAGGLVVLHNDTVAMRFFRDVASQENNVQRHLKDHDLISLADFDEDTLVISPFVTPHVVLAGAKYAELEAVMAEDKESVK